MRALTTWTGREGKVHRGDRITVTEARARELEGYQQTATRRMGLAGQNFDPEEPVKVKARAVRLHNAPADKGETKGGPRAEDRHGRTEKQPAQAPSGRTESTETKTPPEATEAAKAHAVAHGADLSAITGSGAGGKITKPDVDAYLAQPPVTGDTHLDRFTADLRECDAYELQQQRVLYEDEADMRYVQAVDAEIARRGEG
jgi:pyruvate/2-oxoglutarate dehydrogenase complex dihydrolipoamide acyltransferase (E2) component